MENFTLQSSNERSTKVDSEQASDVCLETPFEVLCAADEQINPAILLAEELMLKGMAEAFDFTEIERAEEILSLSRAEISRIENQFAALVQTPPAPASLIPLGF